MARHVTGLEISRYADGELAPVLAERLESHLAVCARCRTRLHAELSLSEELREYFLAAPGAAPAARRRYQPAARYVSAAAAAAVFLGVAAFPRLVGDLTPTVAKGQSGTVQSFVGYYKAIPGQQPHVDIMQGYVVGQGKDSLVVQNGMTRVQVNLPTGSSVKQYPVGSAVLLSGIPQSDGSLQLYNITRISP